MVPDAMVRWQKKRESITTALPEGVFLADGGGLCKFLNFRSLSKNHFPG